jgi:hypothetical protein
MEGNNPSDNNPNNSTPTTPASAGNPAPENSPPPALAANPVGPTVHHTLDTSFGQKTIRTYESDIAEAIEHKKASQVSINLAEVQRQRVQGMTVAESDATPHGSIGKNILKILISIILIAAGGLGGYYLYSISPLALQPIITQQTAPLVPAIIMPDAQKTINIQGQSPAQIVSQIASQATSVVGEGQITELIFYQTSSPSVDGSSQTTGAIRITAPEFISMMGLTPPDVLTRSLTDSWMFGLYGGESGATPFIILTTNFFQNAFSGMLKWEPTMADDLSNLFSFAPQSQSTYIPIPVVMPVATTSTSSKKTTTSSTSSTASSTASAASSTAPASVSAPAAPPS